MPEIKQLRKAELLILRGSYEEAVGIYESILEETSELPEAYVGLLRATTYDYLIHSDYKLEDLIAYVKKALQNFPDFYDEDYECYLVDHEQRLKNEAAKKEAERQALLAQKEEEQKAALAEKWKIGNIVLLGSYYQDNATDKTPIEWIVLDHNGDNALLISKKVLDVQQFHNARYIGKSPIFSGYSYFSSHLHYWLENHFYDIAFREETTKVSKHALFMLDQERYEKYQAHLKPCLCTEYVQTLIPCEQNACSWWLTDTCYEGEWAKYVDGHGGVSYDRIETRLGIRPCVYVQMK